MSAVANRAVLPRRAVLAGAAVAALVAPIAGAMASAGDPVFAAKKRETVAAWANLHALYEEQERRIDALDPRPVLPKELLQPLRLPGKATPTAAHEDGWCAHTLSDIVRTGVYLTAETTPTANGGTMRIERKPVSTKTRKQAAELLKVRQAYDESREKWWQQVRAIEETSTEPLARAVDLAFALMAYPVFTVAEVREKLALVEEFDLINLTDDEADLWGWLIRDAIAVAEKSVSRV